MRVTPNIQGALFMVGSMTAYTLNDAFFKLLNEELPFFQALFLRTALVGVMMLALASRLGVLRVTLHRKDRWLIVLRMVAEVGAGYLFLTALVNLPIANVTAIIQALALTVTLGAALFLGEALGWRRVVAICIGFVGVMLIVQPGSDGFSLYSLYAVGAVICATIRDLAARRISAEVPSMFIAFITALGVLVFSGVGAAFTDWASLSARGAGFVIGSGIFVMCAYLFSVMAMRVGEVGFVNQFRYTSLLVALVVGLLVFGEWPDAVTLLGAGIVVATGLFTLWRERTARAK